MAASKFKIKYMSLVTLLDSTDLDKGLPVCDLLQRMQSKYHLTS